MKKSGAVILSAVLVCTLSCRAHNTYFGKVDAQVEDKIVIRNLQPPGAFEVENLGPDIDVDLPVTIQQFSQNTWSDRLTIALAETCAPDGRHDPVHLANGARLRPVLWSGFDCSAQCSGHCRANIYLGPGTFRFVVSTTNEKHKIYGPSFVLPAAKHS